MYPGGQMQDSINLATPPLPGSPSPDSASTAVSMVMLEILNEKTQTGNEMMTCLLMSLLLQAIITVMTHIHTVYTVHTLHITFITLHIHSILQYLSSMYSVVGPHATWLKQTVKKIKSLTTRVLST